ncbi:hypothetical protein OC835_003145 [Tilletia horrida]|nr:hypothetical protein OC835_003145 [Tilletia horrida]
MSQTMKEDNPDAEVIGDDYPESQVVEHYHTDSGMWCGPPPGMSESHPWQVDENPWLYTAAREHMRSKERRGLTDLFLQARSDMDNVLSQHASTADRRPFIRLIDNLCAMFSLQEQMLDEANAATAQRDKTVDELRTQIARRDVASNAEISNFKYEIQLHDSAQSKLRERIDALAQELHLTHSALSSERHAKAEATAKYRALWSQHSEVQAQASKSASKVTLLQTRVVEMESQLQRLQHKESDSEQRYDDARDSLRDAERDNQRFIKKIIKMEDDHAAAMAKQRETHDSRMDAEKTRYDKMRLEFCNERDRLWSEIVKLLPPDDGPRDLLQPQRIRGIVRKDFLARKLITTTRFNY